MCVIKKSNLNNTNKAYTQPNWRFLENRAKTNVWRLYSVRARCQKRKKQTTPKIQTESIKTFGKNRKNGNQQTQKKGIE